MDGVRSAQLKTQCYQLRQRKACRCLEEAQLGRTQQKWLANIDKRVVGDARRMKMGDHTRIARARRKTSDDHMDGNGAAIGEYGAFLKMRALTAGKRSARQFRRLRTRARIPQTAWSNGSPILKCRYVPNDHPHESMLPRLSTAAPSEYAFCMQYALFRFARIFDAHHMRYQFARYRFLAQIDVFAVKWRG